MSESEAKTIKAAALYRLHEAKANVGCHRKKIDSIIGALYSAAKVISDPDSHLQVVVVHNQVVLAAAGDTVKWPSQTEAATAFQEFQKALKEQEEASSECRNLGMNGV